MAEHLFEVVVLDWNPCQIWGGTGAGGRSWHRRLLEAHLVAGSTPTQDGACGPVNVGVVTTEPGETQDEWEPRRPEDMQLDGLMMVARQINAHRCRQVGDCP